MGEDNFKFGSIKPQKTAWYSQLQLDHLIPIVIAGSNPVAKRILNHPDNAQYIHKDCHTIKTSEDQALISKYKLTRKNVMKELEYKNFSKLNLEQKDQVEQRVLREILNSTEFLKYEVDNIKTVNKLSKLNKNT